jgi:hypothetical protein
MTDQIVTAEALFDFAAVNRLVDYAQALGSPIDLAKDDGAYLMTHAPDGQPVKDLIVYANGHQPPPQAGLPQFSEDDPWLKARVATEEVFGADDFVNTFTPQEISAALTQSGLLARTTLTAYDIPEEFLGRDPWGRRGPVFHLQGLELGPAAQQPEPEPDGPEAKEAPERMDVGGGATQPAHRGLGQLEVTPASDVDMGAPHLA